MALVVVADSWYVPLVAESYRMEFPVGILIPQPFLVKCVLYAINVSVLILIQARVRVRAVVAVVIGIYSFTYCIPVVVFTPF